MDYPQQSSFIKRLNTELGYSVLKLVRKWETTRRKIARYRNHLHYTLHCKHHGITLVSLRITTSMKGTNVDKIIGRTQKQLMSERISQIYRTLKALQSADKDMDEQLFLRLPGTWYEESKQWVTQAEKAEFDKCRCRQQNKFARLQGVSTTRKNDKRPLAMVSDQEKEAVKDRWVVNRSSRSLNDQEMSLLRKGLNFAVAPSKLPSKLPVNELITSVEKACKVIGNDKGQADSLRTQCVNIIGRARIPSSNISKGEISALKSLRQDKDILILPADKGRAVCIMNKSEYMSKAEELLSDTNTYKVEKKNPTTSCTKKLNVILKDLKEQGAIEQNTYRHLSPTSQECPKFYGLPKIHKASVPLRPIVSCRGTPIYNTAKFVARIIKPLVGKSSHHVENSQDLIKKLKCVTVEDDEIMASFDVTALFTNVPIRESLDIIEQRLKEDETLKDRTILSVAQIIRLLECCLTTTYFLFNGKFYTQTEGSAMGSPVSPHVANLFMEHFEVKAIGSFNHVVKFWARYVDDTFCIIHQDKIEEFTTHLNSQHDKIKFTIEKEDNNSLPMLDVKVKRNTNGQLSFSVYRKPTHTDHYLQFSSHQPLEHKLGVVRTLQHRTKHHITTA